MSIILKPFAWALLFLNNITGSYGVALILFALVIKLILFPFAYKGKKSMIKTSQLQGRMKKLQEQYKNNKQKYNEEVQKLYADEKVSPMSGCLWSIIPLVVLMLLYAIIRQPMQYMMGLSSAQITNIAKSLAPAWSQAAAQFSWPEAFSVGGYNELFLSSLITPENAAGIQSMFGPAATSFGNGVIAINFKFLGMNLAQVPEWKIWNQAGTWNNIGLFIMPIISALLSVAFSIISMKTNNITGNKEAAQAQGGSTKLMMVISPLLSLWIGFAMPAGLCVYWIINNLLSMAQELICAKMLKKDYEAAAEAARQQAILDKEEEKRRKAALAEERARRAEERKKGGKKKAKTNESGVAVSASRVGIRAYARGRNYDPDRYGGVTPYKDPEVDEDAIEAALEKKAAAREEAELEAELVARIEAEVAQEYKEGKLVETSDEAVAAAEKAAEEAEREAREAERGAQETDDEPDGVEETDDEPDEAEEPEAGNETEENKDE